jgi:hypothetical protein
MKILVITGKGEKIIGTAHQVDHVKNPEAGNGGPMAGPRQTAHVIDLPHELEKVESAEELHRGLKKHVRSQRKSSKSARKSKR